MPPLHLLQEGLQAYLNGETGVSFERLAEFAEPLFQLYGVDLRAGGRAAAEAEELAVLLAVLETARLLWAYFELDDDGRLRGRSALEKKLLGPEPDEEARADLDDLLQMMEEHWLVLSAERRSAAHVPGFALPSFERLLEQYAPEADAGAAGQTARHYGPEALELPEALALFTRPLLEERPLLDDPDALASTLARAQAYWELAHAPRAEFSAHLDSIKRTYADSPADAERIDAEARRMVAHFFRLFPEQKHTRQ